MGTDQIIDRYCGAMNRRGRASACPSHKLSPVVAPTVARAGAMIIKRRSIFLLLLVAASCGNPQFPRQTPEEISASRVTQDDVRVYDAVMAACASNQVFRIQPPPPPPPGYKPPPTVEPERLRRRKVRLHHSTDVRPEEEVGSPAADWWFTLSGQPLPPLSVPPEAVREFADRNKRSASLKNYKPTNVDVERLTPQDGSRRPFVVSLTLPGYSANRDSAIVEVSISTSSVTGVGQLLFLRKINGQWQIVAKQRTWIT